MDGSFVSACELATANGADGAGAAGGFSMSADVSVTVAGVLDAGGPSCGTKEG